MMNESNAVPIRRRQPASIILDILLSGEPVLVDGEEWRYENGVFGICREVLQDGMHQSDIILGVDMTVPGFISWCEKLPEEVVMQAIFNKVVHQERKRKR